MNCEQCSENMSAYLDGELDSQASDRAEAHLASCEACSSELESLQDAARFVEANAGELSLSPGVWMRVHEQISVSETHPVKPHWSEVFLVHRRWLAATAAAAVILIGLGAFGVMLQKRQLDRDASALMHSYTRQRDIQEQWHFAQEEDPAIAPPEAYADGSLPDFNPFAVVKYEPDKNPFRSEEP
jgi:anti-sigma factor RsiW